MCCCFWLALLFKLSWLFYIYAAPTHHTEQTAPKGSCLKSYFWDACHLIHFYYFIGGEADHCQQAKGSTGCWEMFWCFWQPVCCWARCVKTEINSIHPICPASVIGWEVGKTLDRSSGRTLRDTQPFTPTGWLEWLVNLTFCFRSVEGSRSTWRKPTQVRART